MLEARNLRLVDGPLARQKLKALRDENTGTPEFRQAMKELALMPEATVGFMGLQRDEETAEPVEYYVNLPHNLDEYLLLVLDPMLATGGSLSATLGKLKGYGAGWISCLHAVAAAPGAERVTNEYPDVNFYAAALDPELDERAFIVPGLGDAGDRLYGTL
jgi:uracil phosphoribosyltransferase